MAPDMPARYAYSLNGENYTGVYTSREEALSAALEAALDPANLNPPQTVFVGRRMEADPHASGHARTLLREMAWQAHDEVGAPAANYLNKVSDQHIQELDGAIGHVLLDWLHKHNLMPTYFRVEGISEHPVPLAPMKQQVSGDNNDEVHQVGQIVDAPQM
jgi:hypothetical protein